MTLFLLQADDEVFGKSLNKKVKKSPIKKGCYLKHIAPVYKRPKLKQLRKECDGKEECKVSKEDHQVIVCVFLTGYQC